VRTREGAFLFHETGLYSKTIALYNTIAKKEKLIMKYHKRKYKQYWDDYDEELEVDTVEQRDLFLLHLCKGCDYNYPSVHSQVYDLNGVLIAMQNGDVKKNTG
jgi:hypothetical protein